MRAPREAQQQKQKKGESLVVPGRTGIHLGAPWNAQPDQHNYRQYSTGAHCNRPEKLDK
jgi:hypothetical protein